MTAPPYLIERTKNRASKAVLKEGTVHIRLAKNLSSVEEKRHIDTLLRRMLKAVVKDEARVRIDPFAKLLTGAPNDTIHLVHGQSVHFEIEQGTRNKTVRTVSGWKLKVGKGTDTRTLHRWLWKLLALSSEPSIRSLVHGINEETLRVPISSIRLKMMKSRWGSCGRKGQIALSTPLLLTSLPILRYVIIHELSHMPHPDHSSRFWKTVETYEPSYRDSVEKLRGFRLVTVG